MRRGTVQLGDKSTLAECDIRDGDVLNTIMTMPGWMQVFVKTLNNSTMSIKVSPATLVEDVERYLSRRTQVDTKYFKLMTHGKYMDPRATLSECNVTDDANIYMRVQFPVHPRHYRHFPSPSYP